MITAQQISRLSDAEYGRLHAEAAKIKCPACGAPAGKGCAFLPGMAYVMAAYHLERWQAIPENKS